MRLGGEILPHARSQDSNAATWKIRPIGADVLPFLILAPRVSVGGTRWHYHIAVEAERHCVDALTQVDGTERANTQTHTSSTRISWICSGFRIPSRPAISDPRTTLVERIDRSLDMMSKVPKMWGSPESMELQALLLLEMRAVATRPSVMRGRPSGLRDAYENFVRASFAEAPSMMLSSILQHMDRLPELPVFLRKFADTFERWLPLDSPDEAGDLVLDLEAVAGAKEIPFSVVCKYFEHFQSGLLELAKSTAVGKRQDRVSKALRATAYAIPEITVVPRRDDSTVVRIQLTQPRTEQTNIYGQPDEYESSVLGAMQRAARVLRWAGSGASIDQAKTLSPTPEERVNVAFQTLKMMPPEGIASVRVGGRLLGSDERVEVKPAHAGQLMSIIEEEQTPTPFDASGHVRALDLDQGWFRIRSDAAGVKCWTKGRGDLLTTASGALASRVKVRVVGKMFVVRRRKMVTIDSVEAV